MTFPSDHSVDVGSFADRYFARLQEAASSVDPQRLAQASTVLNRIYAEGNTVFSCGNGGSAAIANHLVCDHGALMRPETKPRRRNVSLSATVEAITAISNDISYDEVFVQQLRSLARPGDALVTISSSGDSENIVRAARWAKDNGMTVISMTGFCGGRSAAIADVNLHVEADNYGVIEDVHQALMHILAQYSSALRDSGSEVSEGES